MQSCGSPDLSWFYREHAHFCPEIQLAVHRLQDLQPLWQCRERGTFLLVSNKVHLRLLFIIYSGNWNFPSCTSWTITIPLIAVGAPAVLRRLRPRLPHGVSHAAADTGARWRLDLCAVHARVPRRLWALRLPLCSTWFCLIAFLRVLSPLAFILYPSWKLATVRPNQRSFMQRTILLNFVYNEFLLLLHFCTNYHS